MIGLSFRENMLMKNLCYGFLKRVWRALIFANQIPSNLQDSTEVGESISITNGIDWTWSRAYNKNKLKNYEVKEEIWCHTLKCISTFVPLEFLLLSSNFQKCFRMVAIPFLSLPCPRRLQWVCWVEVGAQAAGSLFGPRAAGLRKAGEGCTQGCHTWVMMCPCPKFLYTSFISWKKVYFYVLRSMNGTL